MDTIFFFLMDTISLTSASQVYLMTGKLPPISFMLELNMLGHEYVQRLVHMKHKMASFPDIHQMDTVTSIPLIS